MEGNLRDLIRLTRLPIEIRLTRLPIEIRLTRLPIERLFSVMVSVTRRLFVKRLFIELLFGLIELKLCETSFVNQSCFGFFLTELAFAHSGNFVIKNLIFMLFNVIEL